MPQPTIKASQAGIEKAKTALKRKGWRPEDLAANVKMGESIGISSQTVKKFLANKNGVNADYFIAICTALELHWPDIEQFDEQLNINYNNPFIPQHGKIDDRRFFFGREREMRRVFETLNSGSSVAVIGERAIGKSSLLQAIYRQAPNQLRHPRQPIYIDLHNVYDEDDFYGALCHKAGIETAKGYQLQRALESHRLLLLLDEVEKINWDGFTNQVRGQLRGLAEGSNAPLRLVVAAGTSLDTLFPDSQDKNMTSPFKGICIEENLKRWDDEISRKFIVSRLQADWLTPVAEPVSFTEAEIVGLIAESGGYPQKLMQLCYQTYASYINDAKSP
jgi:DNA-binding Xre family transcriptional regulator